MGNLRSRTVYVVGVSDNPVKIGLASKFQERLTSLQIANPDPLIVHHKVRVPDHLGQLVESAAHKHFADRHRRGEWFNVPAAEAVETVKRIAQDICNTNAAISRYGDDPLDQLEAVYPIAIGARTALRHYLDRLRSAYGKRDVAVIDAALIKRCGPATYTLFKRIFAEQRSLYELFLELGLNPMAKTRAESSLAKAINTLTDVVAWEREEALRRQLDVYGRSNAQRLIA